MFMGQHGAHLGPTGPRWAPFWSHEAWYLGTSLSHTRESQISRVLQRVGCSREALHPLLLLFFTVKKSGSDTSISWSSGELFSTWKTGTSFANRASLNQENRERHTAHTIVPWPHHKQWMIAHTSDLMMIITQSINYLNHHKGNG